MTYSAKDINDYLNKIPSDRSEALTSILNIIRENIPEGFSEQMQYKMPSFVVPHSIYPKGYHCNTKEPLPFISVASQKNFIALYHLGIYADPEILDWFTSEYQKLNIGKLDMGKSCIRFKNINKIPYELIGQLCSKISVNNWINIYETSLKREK